MRPTFTALVTAATPTLLLLLAGVLPAVAQATPVVTGEAVSCPGLDYQRESGLAGLVRELDQEVTIPHARVMVSWTDAGGARSSRTVQSGDDGSYVVCGLPIDTPLTIQAGFASYTRRPATVRIAAGPPAGWDFGLEIAADTPRGDSAFPGRIIGTVSDRTSERPIDSAQLQLMGDDQSRMTDGNGRFSFADLTPGVYRIAVNHIAYDRTEQIVNVPANRTVEVNFGLSADPIEVEPLVVTVVRDTRLEIKGFYDRQEIGEKVGIGYFM